MPCALLAAFVLLLAMPPQIQSAADAEQAIVTAAAPIFLLPDTARTPLRTVPVNTPLKIVADEGEWVQVEFRDPEFGRRVGYVQRQFVRLVKPAATPAPPQPAATAINVAPMPAEAVRPVPAPPTPTIVPPAGEGLRTDMRTAPTEDRVPGAKIIGGAPIGGRRPFCAGQSPCRAFTFADKVQAVQAGLAYKGGHTGLILRDSGKGFMNALTAASNGLNASNRKSYSSPTTVGSSGFWIEAWTPAAWIAQQASTAAKEYRQFTAESITDEMMEPVFRVIVHPDTPSEVSAAGVAGTRSVQRVVLRNKARTLVVQPTSTKPNTEEVANAMGGRVSYVGLEATFPLDGLRALRGPQGDQEFLITVVATSGSERNFTVKEKHFKHMD